MIKALILLFKKHALYLHGIYAHKYDTISISQSG